MQRGRIDRRDAAQRPDVPEAERAEHREVEPADCLGEVAERVGARVAVVGGIRQRAGAARISDDDERPPRHGERGLRSFSERATGPNVSLSTRGKTLGGANASTTTSAP